jgi:hypothetical protein
MSAAARCCGSRPNAIVSEPLRTTTDASFGHHRGTTVKSAGVVCDGYRVIFMSDQALSAGMVGWVVTS